MNNTFKLNRNEQGSISVKIEIEINGERKTEKNNLKLKPNRNYHKTEKIQN